MISLHSSLYSVELQGLLALQRLSKWIRRIIAAVLSSLYKSSGGRDAMIQYADAPLHHHRIMMTWYSFQVPPFGRDVR